MTFRCADQAAGGSDDWFFAVVGVRFSYTLELPVLHGDGFPVRKEDSVKGTSLIQIREEALVGMKALVSCAFSRSHG